MSMFTDFSRALAADPIYPPNFTYVVRGYQTPEDCAAWFRGERTLFDDLEDWLSDASHPVRSLRQDERGVYWVALSNPIDAVAFKLCWSEHLVRLD